MGWAAGVWLPASLNRPVLLMGGLEGAVRGQSHDWVWARRDSNQRPRAPGLCTHTLVYVTGYKFRLWSEKNRCSLLLTRFLILISPRLLSL